MENKEKYNWWYWIQWPKKGISICAIKPVKSQRLSNKNFSLSYRASTYMFMKNFKVTFLNCTFLEILHLLCRKDTWGFLFSPFWKRKYNTWWYLIQVVINLMVNNLHSFFSKKWYTPDWDKNIHKKFVSDLIIHTLYCTLCTYYKLL